MLDKLTVWIENHLAGPMAKLPISAIYVRCGMGLLRHYL